MEFRFIDPARQDQGPCLRERYLDPGVNLFLVTNNRLFRYDRLLHWSPPLPLPMVHGLHLISGVYHRFDLYSNEHTRDRVLAQLRALRRSAISPRLRRECLAREDRRVAEEIVHLSGQR